MTNQTSDLWQDFNQRGILDAAPIFNIEKWRENSLALCFKTNCLGYALDIPEDTMSAFRQYVAFEHDVFHMSTVFGLKPVEDNDLANLPDGHYPIIGRFTNSPTEGGYVIDYHWYRLDQDGSWSHKLGWNRAPAKLTVSHESKNAPYPNFVDGEEVDYPVFAGLWAKDPNFVIRDFGALNGLKEPEGYEKVKRHIKHAIENRRL